MQNIFLKEITSKRVIKATLIAIGMGIGFAVFGGVLLLSLYLGDKYIYDVFYKEIFQEPIWYLFLSLVFVITSLLGIWLIFKIKKFKDNNKSFTLIELLVVIAIIGVLAAIIITTISGAVTKSRIVRLQVFSDSIRAQLSDSLVSYWSFNEGTGTDAKDMWEGNDGSLSGFNWDDDSGWRSGGECISGKCLEFDGVDDYIHISDNSSLDIVDNMTLELWLKPGDITAAYQSIFERWAGGTQRRIYQSGPYIYFEMMSGDQHGAGTISVADKWIMIAITCERNGADTDIKSYIDGVVSIQWKETDVLLDWNVSRYLNLSSYATGRFWKGSMDEVRIYNSAASITQIQLQYLAGLDKLLSNGAISKSEYNQRIKELSKEIVIE